MLTERDVLDELQQPTDVLDGHVRNVGELREMAESLVRLQPHDQGQKLLLGSSPAARPRDLIHRSSA
ncbi:hypothetical protein [Saccharopolyspora sp. CA-218241]|uniref:hypothetical protein n=1 Tax=Saccharopolyspora sp. CA-218241 TaxID=3240027 RepID=UPI003D961418